MTTREHVMLPVCPDTAWVSPGGRWEWLDWEDAWRDGGKIKVSNGNAPPEYCPECVYRVWPRVGALDAWDQHAQVIEEDPDEGEWSVYLPPVCVLNGRWVLDVKPVEKEGAWWWLVSLGDEVGEPRTRTMEEVCAWCGVVIRRKEVPETALPMGLLPSGTLQSHGICQECAEAMDPDQPVDGGE